MARAASADFLQNFRFHVTARLADGPEVGLDPMRFEGGPGGLAGFASVVIPEVSVNTAEYRDGISVFTYKQPGIPTFSDITMTRGVARKDTRFFDWMLRYFQGSTYRADLTIYEWDQIANPAEVGNKPDDQTGFDQTLAREYDVREAFPTTVKPSGDKDANGDDISVGEVTVAYESFRQVKPVTELPAASVPATP